MGMPIALETLESRQARLRDDLDRAGAIRKGHFLLRGRHHSDIWINFPPAMELPHIRENVGAILIMQLEEKGLIVSGHPIFDLVLGPARGAILIGETIRRLLPKSDVLAVYPKRNSEDGKFTFKYPFPHCRQIPTLYADDLYSTGSTLREIMIVCDEVADAKNAEEPATSTTKRNASFEFVGSAVAINRVPDIEIFKLNTITFPISYALWIQTELVTPERCSQCAKEIPLEEGTLIL